MHRALIRRTRAGRAIRAVHAVRAAVRGLRAARAVLALRAALLLLPAILASSAFATFSITAVDPATQEVGSAGASCIAGSIILSDVHPGRGAVHTQASWNSQNQQYARTLMNQGYAPQAIIDSLVAHDAQGNPTIRQYGIVDLVGGGRSAGYTGIHCTDYKGHILGPTYAIQGNILLGPQILQGMEIAFGSTAGTLADRLMAALQAAKIPGADTRCTSYHKSSISAFLRVALPSDGATLHLDLNVNNTPTDQDPIDVLQGLYDQWKLAGVPAAQGVEGLDRVSAYPNPFRATTVLSYAVEGPEKVTLRVFDLAGREIDTLVDGTQEPGLHQTVWAAPEDAISGGVYFCRLQTAGHASTVKLLHLGR